ncbi:MAG: DNA polymerase III subunit [Chloroflexi bacterium]|nr:DNA polymerase III subunit [Chloroflexota bacterium]
MATTEAWGLVGHERAVDFLRRAIEHHRIGHAYLLSGPRGVGKRALAVAFAQALNCERLGPAARLGPGAERSSGEDEEPPCGRCRRCRLIAEGTHPEVRIVGLQPPHRVIRVADVEAIQADAALRPADAYRKIYVVEQAELLHPDAANRLLKTIEEPPPLVMVILTTVDPEATLETIVSRCQHIRLRRADRAALAEHLVGQTGVAPECAHLLAALAEGCTGRALNLANDDRALERRTKLLDDLDGLLGADRLARLQYARTLGDRWSKDQDEVRGVLAQWVRWWRDVLLVQGGTPDRIVNLDRRCAIERHAARLSRGETAGALASARDVLQMLDQNVNARLALDVVLLDLPRPGRAA